MQILCFSPREVCKKKKKRKSIFWLASPLLTDRAIQIFNIKPATHCVSNKCTSKTFRDAEMNVQHDKLLVQKTACKSFLDGKNFCDQPHLWLFSSLLHTQYLPLPGVCFFAKSAYSEMPPSFYVVGQLQAFLVALQRKAQIAKMNSNNSLLDLTPLFFASSAAQEILK